MRTSFVKTFTDVQKGKSTLDLMFPDRETKTVVTDESGGEFSPDKIFESLRVDLTVTRFSAMSVPRLVLPYADLD